MKHQRVLTAALLAPTAIAAVLLMPTPWLAALAAVAMLAGLWEFSRLAGIPHTLGRVAYLAANAAVMAWLAWFGLPGLGLTVVLAGVLWWLAAALWLRRPALASGQGSGARALKLLAGSLAVVPAWVALTLLHLGAAGHGTEPAWSGPAWTLLALAIVWAADTGAYFSGRRFGRRKLAPTISPNKTWEGLWGGLAAAVVLAVLAAPALGVGVQYWPVMALLAALAVAAAVVGDLFESLIKRHAGCKDSGHLVPGHGGVLDRLDSVLAALPVIVVGRAVLGL